MTDVEKKKIEEMRDAGLSYKQIADETDLSINTVKSFCRRRGNGDVSPVISKAEPMETEKPVPKKIEYGSNSEVCRYCGKPLFSTSGKRKKKFCSDTCRVRYWSEHRNDLPHKITYTYRCAHCGKEFTIYGKKSRKYCSTECYFADRFGLVEARSKVSGHDANLQEMA